MSLTSIQNNHPAQQPFSVGTIDPNEGFCSFLTQKICTICSEIFSLISGIFLYLVERFSSQAELEAATSIQSKVSDPDLSASELQPRLNISCEYSPRATQAFEYTAVELRTTTEDLLPQGRERKNQVRSLMNLYDEGLIELNAHKTDDPIAYDLFGRFMQISFAISCLVLDNLKVANGEIIPDSSLDGNLYTLLSWCPIVYHQIKDAQKLSPFFSRALYNQNTAPFSWRSLYNEYCERLEMFAFNNQLDTKQLDIVFNLTQDENTTPFKIQVKRLMTKRDTWLDAARIGDDTDSD